MPKDGSDKPKGKGGKPKGYRHSEKVPEALALVADLVAGGMGVRLAAKQVGPSRGISWERLRKLFAYERESLLKAAENRRRPKLPQPASPSRSAATVSVTKRRDPTTAELIEKRVQRLKQGEALTKSLEAIQSMLIPKGIEEMQKSLLGGIGEIDVTGLLGGTAATLDAMIDDMKIDSKIYDLRRLRWMYSDPTLDALIEMEIGRLEAEKIAARLRKVVRDKPSK